MPDRLAARSRWRDGAICLVLCGVGLFAYWPMLAAPNQFLLYDDVGYVTGNGAVLTGVNLASVRWAATSVVTDNWHPVTMLSHLVDVELFGLDPRWHHATNLGLHLANSLLVYLVLRGMTGAVWRAALVAALFAWHPLRVESVAWLAERKDVLCALFWLLSLAAYTAYARRGGRGWYLLVAMCFVLALLSKPMAVTLPCLLLLLDFWPLARVPENWWKRPEDRRLFARLCIEKLPLLAISAMFVVTTLWTQSSRNLVTMPDVGTRLGQSAVSYWEYLAKGMWPSPLYMPYLYSERAFDAVDGVLAVAMLLMVSIAVLAARGRRYLAVGWFWFLGTLVPVIGLVQVGAQSIADRYTYLPMIGIYLVFAWLAGELAARSIAWRVVLLPAIGVGLVALVALTRAQVPVWYDTSTLFAHTLYYAPRNHIALGAYGSARLAAGDYAAAIEHCQLAIEEQPDMFEPTINLARIYRHLDEPRESIDWYRRAIMIQRDNVGVHAELARLLSTVHDESLRNGVEAELLAKRASAAYAGQNPAMLDILAMAFAAQGKFDEARATATQALRIARAREQAGDTTAGILATGLEERLELYRQNQPFVISPERK